nr:hypothetical protein [Tanacetum cinerariifolium]
MEKELNGRNATFRLHYGGVLVRGLETEYRDFDYVNIERGNRVRKWSFTTDLRGLGFKDEEARNHYKMLNQINKLPTAKNNRKEFISDVEDEDSVHDEVENYLDNSDIEILNEEILEDGTTKMMRTRAEFPRYNEYCKTVSFLLSLSFTGHMQFKKALLKYAVQEKRDYTFVKNARYRVRVKRKDVHCNWLVYAANVKHNGKNYFLVKTLNEKHTCSKLKPSFHDLRIDYAQLKKRLDEIENIQDGAKQTP